jgi:hypothetical protein
MNRNQKIALGCGAAGCLGLVLAVVLGGVAYFALKTTTINSNRRYSSNINQRSTGTSNANTDESEASNTSADETPSGSMSDDDKHKLFQAAAVTQDTILIQHVWHKIGLAKADGTPNDHYTQFMKDHVAWLFSNSDFIQTVNTPEKAREYVEAHLND